jgi:hypothetical protein
LSPETEAPGAEAEAQPPSLTRPALFDTGVWTWVRDRRFPHLAQWFNAQGAADRTLVSFNCCCQATAITAGSLRQTC